MVSSTVHLTESANQDLIYLCDSTSKRRKRKLPTTQWSGDMQCRWGKNEFHFSGPTPKEVSAKSQPVRPKGGAWDKNSNELCCPLIAKSLTAATSGRPHTLSVHQGQWTKVSIPSWGLPCVAYSSAWKIVYNNFGLEMSLLKLF